MSTRLPKLKRVLGRLYNKYNHRRLIKPDPLQFVYHYSVPADREIVSFLAADLAYGRVRQIEIDLTDLFSRMGKSPHAFVAGFSAAERRALRGFKHRFTDADDIADLLTLLKAAVREHGSIERFFARGYDPRYENIIPALSQFSDSLCAMYRREHGREPAHGLKYLLVDPQKGSACKRLNLFLRWMVRDDDVDTGLWKSVDKAKLIVPVDTHMFRLCRILGLHSQKTTSLSAARKITQSFLEIEPSDPVKYDFALSRIGIVEGCTGRYNLRCKGCELEKFCK